MLPNFHGDIYLCCGTLALAEYAVFWLCSIPNNSSINISREICPFNWNCKKNELWSANNYNGSVSVQAPPYYHGSVDMYLSKSKRLWLYFELFESANETK